MKNWNKIACIGLGCSLLASCGNITREDGVQTASALGGAGLGYALAPDGDENLFAAGGALIGGLGAAQLAGNQDYKNGVEDGKVQGYSDGQADTAKRMYWVLQAAQGRGRDHGNVTLRQVDIPPTQTEDGRYLMARRVTIPIVDSPN